MYPMYVADVTDLAELHDLLDEAMHHLAMHPCDQNRWDVEDISARIEELS